MSAAPRPGARLRAALLLAAFAVAAWLLAQGSTLLWQAAGAGQLGQRVASGQPLYAWDFAEASAIVAPGSEGLAGAQHQSGGLHPADGAAVVDLSLQLDGRPVAGQAYSAATLGLRTAAPARVLLLAPDGDGGIAVVANRTVDAGEHSVDLALAPFARAAGWLRLRIERDTPGQLVLRSLSLTQPRCEPVPGAQATQAGVGLLPAECIAGAILQLPPQETPEAFLQARDTLLALAPATVAGAAVPQPLATAAQALRATWFHGIALLAAVLVLGWSLWARRIAQRPDSRAAARGKPVDAPAGRAHQLAILLAIPLALLLSGQPDRHDQPLVLLALLTSFAAALLHPGGRRDWHWLGDRAAWAAAARLTLAGAVLIGVVALVGGLAGEPAGNWRAARLPRYLAWALLQQALLLVVIMPRLAPAGRDPRIAASCAGGLFALLHLPNFGLMLATLLAGTAWASQGHRHGALLPLALSHALLGTLLAWATTPWLLRSAEVGGRFLMPG